LDSICRNTVSGPSSVWIDSELGENEKISEMSVMEMDDLESAKSVTKIISPEPCASHMIPTQNDRKLQNSGNNCVETGKNISFALYSYIYTVETPVN